MGKPNPKNSYPLFFFPSQPFLTLTASISSKFFDISDLHFILYFDISASLSSRQPLFHFRKDQGFFSSCKRNEISRRSKTDMLKKKWDFRNMLVVEWGWTLLGGERGRGRCVNEEKKWRVKNQIRVLCKERSKFWIGVVFRRARGEVEVGGIVGQLFSYLFFIISLFLMIVIKLSWYKIFKVNIISYYKLII